MTAKQILITSLAALALAGVPACTTSGGGGITLEADGVCVTSADGGYAVCYDPFTRTYKVRANVRDGMAWTMVYDKATKTLRAKLPSGGTAVYANGKLTIEPPLPDTAPPPK